jgi:hypothetical protein
MSRPTFAEPDASPSWLARNRGEHSTAEGEAASEGLAGQGPVPSAAPPVPAPLLAGLGGGQPLAQAERQRWQGEAGADLAAVRVHRGPAAARAAASLAARAFTIGDHVVFGAGQYTPGTPAGDGLMRHELTHVLQQRRGVVPLAPQRQADPQADPQVARDKAPWAATPGTAVLQSPHPEVGGRTVAEVGRDLRERAERYRKMSAANVRSSAEQQQTERDWYADRGVAGSVIEWFNRRVPTDPARWGSVMAVYEHATRLFDEALAVAVNADTVADFARRCQDALERFQAAMELERRYLAEWRRYIEGFAGAAESLYSTAVVVRDCPSRPRSRSRWW